MEVGVKNNIELNKFFIQNKLSFLPDVSCLTINKLSFEKIVRKILIDIKISKDAFIIIQYFVEQKICQLLQYANFACIHANRDKLIPSDINFVISLYENAIPEQYIDIEEVNEEDIEAD